MNIGFQTSKYNGISMLDELKYTVERKADFYDVFFDCFLPSDIDSQTIEFIEKMKNDGFRFTVHMPIPFPQLKAEEIKSLVEFVHWLKPETVTVHFDNLTYEFLNYLLCEIGNETCVCVENTIPDLNDNYGKSYIGFMKEACKLGKVYSTLDTGHCNVNGYNPADFASDVSEIPVEIKTVHAHDNDGKHDYHWKAGNGNIDFKCFFSKLRDRNMNPYVVIEHWPENAEAMNYLRKCSD